MRERVSYVLSFVMVFLLAACSQERGNQPAIDPGSVSVVNGIVTDSFPAVFRLTTARGGTCTATAVSSTTAITAGHCVTRGLPSAGKIRATALRSDVRENGIDLAIVVFPADTFANTASVINRAPVSNDPIVVVGYGHIAFPPTSPLLDGKKRYGFNRLMGFANQTFSPYTITHRPNDGDYLHYRSPASIVGLDAGESAMSSNGDSGGPILIDGKLAGVTSGGDTYAEIVRAATVIDDPAPDESGLYEYDSNLYSAVSIALMDKAVAEVSAVISGLDCLKRSFFAPPPQQQCPRCPRRPVRRLIDRIRNRS